MTQSLASISELVPVQARLLSRNAASDLCSEVRVVGVSIECLGIVNGLLDEILIRILEHSQSFRLALLRRATLDVIGVGFGQNAITEAEMKLKQQQSHRSYLSEQSSERVENFPLNAAFNVSLHVSTMFQSKTVIDTAALRYHTLQVLGKRCRITQSFCHA